MISDLTLNPLGLTVSLRAGRADAPAGTAGKSLGVRMTWGDPGPVTWGQKFVVI